MVEQFAPGKDDGLADSVGLIAPQRRSEPLRQCDLHHVKWVEGLGLGHRARPITIGDMYQHFRISLIAFVVVFGLAFGSLAVNGQDNAPKRGRKYKAPPPTARIEVTVLRDVSGKPIENAAVIFHTMESERDKGNMELKTNEDGKAIIDVLPLGDTVRLQIIAKGFQTYGEDYKIGKPEMAIEIKMKRPGEQYSVYKNHDGTVGTGKSSEGANPAQAAPDSGTQKPDNSTKQPDAQPGQPQAK